MKVKTSRIAFISFHFLFRLEIFQWVMGKKIKKTDSVSTRVTGCARASFHPFLFCGAPGGDAYGPLNMKDIAHWSNYRKKNSHGAFQTSIKPRRLVVHRPAPTIDAECLLLGQSATSRERNSGIPPGRAAL